MTQIMFETFNMPAMYVAIQAVLSLYAIVHQGRREMLLPVVEEIVEAVVVEVIAEAEEEEAINKSLALLRKLSLPWDRSTKIVKAKCDPDMDENMSGILYSLLTFRAFL